LSESCSDMIEQAQGLISLAVIGLVLITLADVGL
jgi:hypothetical protein